MGIGTRTPVRNRSQQGVLPKRAAPQEPDLIYVSLQKRFEVLLAPFGIHDPSSRTLTVHTVSSYFVDSVGTS